MKRILLDFDWSDNLGEHASTQKRFEFCRKFIHQNIDANEHNYSVLDIGPKNSFGITLSQNFGMSYCCTGGNLNNTDWVADANNKHYQVVFCFTILEKLMNPLSFLEKLKGYCNDETLIFVYHPFAPSFFETHHHFHDFRDNEFFTLITTAGYEIVVHEKFRLWSCWKFYLSGLRPILRFFCMSIGITRSSMYLLRLR